MPFHDSLINARRAALCCSVILSTMFAASIACAAAPSQPVPRPFVPPSKNEVLIRQYLYEADDALSRNRLTAPKNDNAYAGYQRVLTLDPRNERARAGVRQVGSRFLALARTAEKSGDFERALEHARQAQRITPTAANLALVRQLEERSAQYDAQQTQLATSGKPAELKFKGNEYFLAAGDVSRRNVTAKSQLVQIADKAKNMDSRILIIAKNDDDGRWMYSQMRDSITEEYRLRGNIQIGPQIKIVLLDQPPANAAPANPTTPVTP